MAVRLKEMSSHWNKHAYRHRARGRGGDIQCPFPHLPFKAYGGLTALPPPTSTLPVLLQWLSMPPAGPVYYVPCTRHMPCVVGRTSRGSWAYIFSQLLNQTLP